MTLSIRKPYFSGLVQPVMDYGCVISGNCRSNDAQNDEDVCMQDPFLT